MASKIEMKSLITKLDSVFSKWIRRRDSENEFGIIQCVTCGKPMDMKTAQCGHFISRRHYATRWEEKNCAAQCVGCNLFNQGKQYEFGLAINKRFGAGTTDKLLIQSKNKFNLNRSVLELLIQKYKI